jgi:hypothetical protein
MHPSVEAEARGWTIAMTGQFKAKGRKTGRASVSGRAKLSRRQPHMEAVSVVLKVRGVSHFLGEVQDRTSVLAPPTGVGRGIAAYRIRIEGRDEWVSGEEVRSCMAGSGASVAPVGGTPTHGLEDATSAVSTPMTGHQV